MLPVSSIITGTGRHGSCHIPSQFALRNVQRGEVCSVKRAIHGRFWGAGHRQPDDPELSLITGGLEEDAVTGRFPGDNPFPGSRN
jgi:hypothetical protein